AASLLQVSGATIRNWLKSGYLQGVIIEGKQLLYTNDLQKLKNQASKRLTQRANKAQSEKLLLPKEYLQNNSELQNITAIINFIQAQRIPTSTALLLLALNLLQKEKMIQAFTWQELINNKLIFNNKQLTIEINDWMSSLDIGSIQNSYSYLLQCSIPLQKDVLGCIYLSLMKEGTKSQKGAYYTPAKVVKDIVSTYVKADSKVLDPCCGTGQFLLAFAEKIKNPTYIYGIDNDEIAVRIARINLILAYKTHDFSPQIFCKHTLIDKLPFTNFNLIASNPPWGAHFSESEKEVIQKKYPDIYSMESFSLFLKKSLELIHPEGVISFILPESILNVGFHKDIRKIILEQTHIYAIHYLNRIFKNVFTPIIRLDISKNSKETTATTIHFNHTSYKVDSRNWKSNKAYNFSIFSTNKDSELLKKIYAFPHTKLEKQASWMLGIVTGNNHAYLSKSIKKNHVPIYKGSDVNAFGFKNPSYYLNFNPEKFQQSAPLEKYRVKEKLVYRFISKRLIFAYDNEQRLTLNSANSVIPSIPNYSMKIITLLFNSSLYQYIFQKKFASIKVLRSHLEDLPLPYFDAESYQQLEHLYNKISQDKKFQNEVDSYIMSLFGLSQEEQEYILDSIK
ncbi:MAG: N-6 DNA methylase, partial [Bacteroidales bacterium]|nr:N-6 DNA methylase [Bacteroidales bacterium]